MACVLVPGSIITCSSNIRRLSSVWRWTSTCRGLCSVCTLRKWSSNWFWIRSQTDLSGESPMMMKVACLGQPYLLLSVVSAGLCAWAWCWSSCARVTSVTSCQSSPVGWASDKCTAEAVSQTFYWPVVNCDSVVLRLATGSGWRWWLGVQVNNLDGW